MIWIQFFKSEMYRTEWHGYNWLFISGCKIRVLKVTLKSKLSLTINMFPQSCIGKSKLAYGRLSNTVKLGYNELGC